MGPEISFLTKQPAYAGEFSIRIECVCAYTYIHNTE